MTAPTLIKNCLAAAALLMLSLAATQSAEAAYARRAANGAIQYFDNSGNDQGYAWCLQRSGRAYGGMLDCSYFTLAQCQASMAGSFGGGCQRNPWARLVASPAPGKRAHR